MMRIKAFIRQHPVLTYYILTFAISWDGGLVVLSPDGFLGITQPSQAQFLFAILAGIAGPSTAGIVFMLFGLVVFGLSPLIAMHLRAWVSGLATRSTGPLAGGVGDGDRMGGFGSNEQPVWVRHGRPVPSDERRFYDLHRPFRPR